MNAIKLFLKSNYYLFKAFRFPFVVIGSYKKKINLKQDDFWESRINVVLQSPDNEGIKRVFNAGEIKGDVQVMHNGIKVHVGSYYGDGNTSLLYRNKGVHEPQEEKSFEEILTVLPSNANMLELGAFWAFYSMTFAKKINQGTNYLIEPDPHALLSGKLNFRLNKLKGHFFNYFISDFCVQGLIPSITVDQFLEDNKIDRLNILHSDIQGFELKMLTGASKHLKNGKIDYVFISTHSNELHQSCKKFLVEIGYLILCDADLDETYSWDGLIVAKHKTVARPERLEISKRQ